MNTVAVLEALDLKDVQAEYARRHLRVFVEQAWPIIEAVDFKPNWHLDVICDQLECITKGEIKRLLINVPPGTAKSLIVSVFWPAWEWATSPTLRYITSSYGQDLATRDAVKMRVLIESAWYQQFWPTKFRGDANQKTRYENEAGGWRLATSVGGRGTGEHPDRFIIDDPHNVKQANQTSSGKRPWIGLPKRSVAVVSAEGAAQVVIMQRLHELDLSGFILSSENAEEWVHVCLPMRAESVSALVPTKAARPQVDRRQPGELLWPTLFTASLVASLERDLGSYATAGQLQQRPAPAEGGILKMKWLRYYEPNTKPAIDRIVISVDPALKDKEQNDFWACQVWGVQGPNRYILRRAHGRWDLAEAIQQLIDLHRWSLEQYPDCGILMLIENAAAGPDAIRALKRRITGVVNWQAKGDKVQRAMSAQPVLEAGNIFVPGAEDASGGRLHSGFTPGWVQEMVHEWVSFPNGAHDDDVDAFTQMVIRLQHTSAIASARLEHLI